MSSKPDFADQLARQLPLYAEMTDPERIALHVADTVCCALGAEAISAKHDNIVGRSAKLVAAQPEDNSGATVWSTGARRSVEAASLHNAISARYLDFNDTYTGRVIVHPSDMIPSIIALGEARRIPWQRQAEAISVAYEVLCMMADQADTRDKGWDPSTLTPIATAAGCAWLVGLDLDRSRSAIQLAALDAPTLRCIRLGKIADWKAVASARGAAKALFALRMAELGTEGPPSTFEASDGFFARVSGAITLEEKPESRVPMVIIKRFPAQIFIQSFMEIAEELYRDLGNRADDIERVVVGTNAQAVRMVGHRDLDHGLNRETADHSAAFCVAAMLVKGRLGYEDVDPFLSDSAVLTLMDKVDVTPAEESHTNYPAQVPASIEILFRDGSVSRARQARRSALEETALASKITGLWPAGRAMTWPWAWQGETPKFPQGLV